jgi:hypothetical protein
MECQSFLGTRTIGYTATDQPRQRAPDSLGTIGRKQMMNFGFNSLLGILILIGDIWAIINIFQSSVSNEKKLIWIVAVVLLPLLGLILWYFLGPRNRRT